MPVSFPLPSASEVRVASRLRPEQVSAALANEAALEADIGERITEQARRVQSRRMACCAPYAWPLTLEQVQTAFPNYSEEQAQDVADAQLEAARDETKLRALGDLYDSAGALNARYQLEAENFFRRAEALREQECEDLNRISSALAAGDTVTVEEETPQSRTGRITSVWY